MAGGNFMGRVISYVVNELVVNGLANSFVGLITNGFKRTQRKRFQLESIEEHLKDLYTKLNINTCPTFQRFAVRTSRRIEDVSKIAAQKKREIAEQMKELSKNLEQNSKKN